MKKLYVIALIGLAYTGSGFQELRGIGIHSISKTAPMPWELKWYFVPMQEALMCENDSGISTSTIALI